MSTSRFTIGQVIGAGWATFKEHAGFLIGALIVGGLLYGIPSLIASLTMEDYPAVGFLFNIISIVISWLVTLGWIRIALNALDKKPLQLSLLWNSTNVFFRYVGANILVTLLTAVGFILLIIPGIIVALRYSLISYYIVDKNQGVTEAMRSSWEATRDSTWNLFLLYLVFGVIGIVACIPLFLGLLIALPVIFIAQAYVYRQLSSHAAPAPTPATV